MYNSNIPTDRELPSAKALIKSTIIAAITAAILLVTTVLPAEYGIDPTGIGQKLGLKKMGKIKTSLAEEAAEDAARDAALTKDATPIETIAKAKTQSEKKSTAAHQDSITVTLAPNEGKEAKVNMSKDAVVTYKWVSEGGIAKFDVHGDSKALKINYHNYEKGAKTTKEGKITAAFDGSHGWFWRNRTDRNITITLDVSGDFSDLKLMQ